MELTKSDNGKWKPGQSGNLNGKDEARRIAVNIAKLLWMPIT
jgi:hypothetical protein